MQSALYDAAGHRRSPVTMPGFHEGRAPRNKGRRYPADPPTVEEIIAVMRRADAKARRSPTLRGHSSTAEVPAFATRLRAPSTTAAVGSGDP